MVHAVLIAGLLAAAAVANGQTVVGWQAMLYRECEGSFQLLPDHAFALQTDMFDVIGVGIGLMQAELKSRLTCACPNDFSQAEFDLQFDPLTAAFNLMSTSTVAPNAALCQNQQYPLGISSLDVFDIITPNTCNFNTWTTSGSCNLSLPLAGLNANVRASFMKCANDPIPAVSIFCDGTGCADIMRICGSSSDCTGSGTQCNPIPGLNLTDLPNQIWQSIIVPSFVPTAFASSSPGNFQRPGIGQPLTPSNDIATALFSHVNRLIFATGATQFVSAPDFCGLDNFINNTVVSGFDMTSTNTTTGNMCIIHQSTYEHATFTTGFQPWTGVFSDGVSVPFGRTNLLPNIVADAPNTLLNFSCDGKLSLNLMGRNAAFRAPGISAAGVPVIALIQDIITAEMSSGISQDAYDARFALWYPLIYLLTFQQGASDNYAFTNNPNFQDWRQQIFGSSHPVVGNLPGSASFQTFLTTQHAGLDWSGLNSLFMLDVTLRFTIDKCGTDTLPFSFVVSCVGADCAGATQGIKPCLIDDDCASLSTGAYPGAAPKCVVIPALIDQLAGTSVNQMDLIDYLFNATHAQAGNPCNKSILGTMVDQQCSGPFSFWHVIGKSINTVFGGQYATNSFAANNRASVCLFNNQITDSTFLTNWAQGVGSKNNVTNVVTINNLAPQGTSPTSTPTSNSPGGSGTPTPKPNAADAVAPLIALVAAALVGIRVALAL